MAQERNWSKEKEELEDWLSTEDVQLAVQLVPGSNVQNDLTWNYFSQYNINYVIGLEVNKFYAFEAMDENARLTKKEVNVALGDVKQTPFLLNACFLFFKDAMQALFHDEVALKRCLEQSGTKLTINSRVGQSLTKRATTVWTGEYDSEIQATSTDFFNAWVVWMKFCPFKTAEWYLEQYDYLKIAEKSDATRLLLIEFIECVWKNISHSDKIIFDQPSVYGEYTDPTVELIVVLYATSGLDQATKNYVEDQRKQVKLLVTVYNKCNPSKNEPKRKNASPSKQPMKKQRLTTILKGKPLGGEGNGFSLLDPEYSAYKSTKPVTYTLSSCTNLDAAKFYRIQVQPKTAKINLFF